MENGFRDKDLENLENLENLESLDKLDKLERLELPILVGICLTCLIFAIIVMFIYNDAFKGYIPFSNRSDWGALGDFFGGVLNPFFSFFTILLLIYTTVLQRRELKATRIEMRQTRSVFEYQKSIQQLEYQIKKAEYGKKVLLDEYNLYVKRLDKIISDINSLLEVERFSIVRYISENRRTIKKVNFINLTKQELHELGQAIESDKTDRFFSFHLSEVRKDEEVSTLLKDLMKIVELLSIAVSMLPESDKKFHKIDTFEMSGKRESVESFFYSYYPVLTHRKFDSLFAMRVKMLFEKVDNHADLGRIMLHNPLKNHANKVSNYYLKLTEE